MTFSKEHLELALRPSKWHCLLLSVVHLLALVALALAGLAPILAIAVGAVVVISFVHSLRRFGLLRDRRSVVRVTWHEGRWQLVLGAGTIMPVDLSATLVVLGWLIVVNFRDAAGTRYPVVLLPDSTSADEFRRLRVLLRWGNLGS